MMTPISFIIYTLIIIGGFICIAAVYVAVNMMVTENRLNISMLKVLGYRDKEIKQMVLSAHHVLLPVGIAAGILAAYLAIRFYFASFAEMEGMLIPTIVKPASIGPVSYTPLNGAGRRLGAYRQNGIWRVGR